MRTKNQHRTEQTHRRFAVQFAAWQVRVASNLDLQVATLFLMNLASSAFIETLTTAIKCSPTHVATEMLTAAMQQDRTRIVALYQQRHAGKAAA